MSSDTFTSGQASRLLKVSNRRVRQMAAEGALKARREADGSWKFDQANVLAERRRKFGGGSSESTGGGNVIDLTDVTVLQSLIRQALAEELPRALEAATSPERLAREQAQEALFEAKARADAAEARISELEAQLAAPKRRRWRRRS